MRHRQMYLLIAPGVMCVTDAALTLAGQPAEYWHNGYQAVAELSPDAHTLLLISPMVFCFGVVGWLLIISSLIWLLPRLLALVFSMAVTVGHSVGCATWTVWRPPYGYQITMAGSIVVGALIALSLALTLRNELRSDVDRASTSLWQWALILAIILIPLYLFLIPH